MLSMKYKVRRNDTSAIRDLGSIIRPRGWRRLRGSSAFRAQDGFLFCRETHLKTEETHEHLDNSIRSFAGRLGGRLHGVPCSGWSDSPSAGFRRNFADFALCAGPARRVRQADTRIRSCPLVGSNTKHNCFLANSRASCPEPKGWNLT